MLKLLLASTFLLGGEGSFVSSAKASPSPSSPNPSSLVLVKKDGTKNLGAKEVNAPTTEKVAETVAPQFKIAGQTSFDNWMFKNQVPVIPGDAKDIPWKRNSRARGQYFSMDDARLRFSIDGKTPLMGKDLEYGLVFVLDGDTAAANTLRENYIFFQGDWGKLFLGDTYGVDGIMAIGAWDNWVGTGFVDGSMVDHTVNLTTGTHLTTQSVGDTGRSTKLSYFTPRWEGFQIGLSYTPRGDSKGSDAPNFLTSSASSKKIPFDTDNIASALNYMHQFANGCAVGVSGTSVFAKAHPEFQTSLARKNVASFALGGRISYKGLGFSTEYNNNGNSRQIAGQNLSNSGQYLSYGLSYTRGATRVSAGYHYSWRKALGGGLTSNFIAENAVAKAVGTAIDHKLAPGLVLYAEYANFQMRNPAAKIEADRLNASPAINGAGQYVAPVPNNKTNSFVVGSRLVF